MPVPTFGQRLGDVRRNPALELVFYLFRAQAEEWMRANYRYSGSPRDIAMLVGIHLAVWLDDRGHAFFERCRRYQKSDHRHDWGGRHQPPVPEPEQVEQTDRKSEEENTARESEHHGNREYSRAKPSRRLPALLTGEEQVRRQHQQHDHLFAAERHPVAHEAGDSLADIEVVKV